MSCFRSRGSAPFLDRMRRGRSRLPAASRPAVTRRDVSGRELVRVHCFLKFVQWLVLHLARGSFQKTEVAQ